MIAGAAAAHGVLLRQAQARDRLARIEDDRARSLDGADKAGCGCGRRRQRLQEIQRRALGSQDRACLARKPANGGSCSDAVAVATGPVKRDRAIELAKGLVEPVPAADDGGVARNYRGGRLRVRRNQ
jgi:hypothetical protein